MNGNGTGALNGSKGLLVGGAGAIVVAVAGFTYKSVDDRIEVRRQEVARLEAKVLEHEGKIATALAERDALQRELSELRAQFREVQQEQNRRTPYIKK